VHFHADVFLSTDWSLEKIGQLSDAHNHQRTFRIMITRPQLSTTSD